MSQLSFLEKLLDGEDVQWLPLGEVTEVRSGWGFPNVYQGQVEGTYPFYKVSDMNTAGNEITMDSANNYIDAAVVKKLGVSPAPAGTIIFPKIGAAVATNKKRLLSSLSAYDNNVMGLIPRKNILSSFLFYWMHTINLSTLANDSGAVPSIRKSTIEAHSIPIPCPNNPKKSLAIQAKIVRILDAFTTLTTKLTTALAAELTARKKQYNYYRNQLLTFDEGEDVKWLPLGDVTTLKRGRVMSKEYFIENAGDFPVYSSQTARNGMIGKIDTFDFDGEYISWTTDGANAGTVFHRTGKFSITNVCGSIKISDELKLNYRFLFYWLSIEAQKHVYSGMGNPKLMSHQVEKIPVPIPCPNNPKKSLAIQAKIVRILDKFHTLTNSITEGLPHEIELRKKQYEYYRDQLLNFPKHKEVTT